MSCPYVVLCRYASWLRRVVWLYVMPRLVWSCGNTQCVAVLVLPRLVFGGYFGMLFCVRLALRCAPCRAVWCLFASCTPRGCAVWVGVVLGCWSLVGFMSCPVVSWYVQFCSVVMCCDVLCRGMFAYAVRCLVLRCTVRCFTWWCVVSCCVVLCRVLLFVVLLCCVLWYSVAFRCVVVCRSVSCWFVWCCVVLCCVAMCLVVLCCVV